MQKINFEQTIKLIHKEINVKLVKANKELDRFLVSTVPIIPKLGNYFFKKRAFLSPFFLYRGSGSNRHEIALTGV